MFWILYTLSAAITLVGIHQGNWYVILPGTIIYLITSAWQQDKENLSRYQNIIDNFPTKDEIRLEADHKAEEFKKMSWFHRIIFITAFNSGCKYIMEKFK